MKLQLTALISALFLAAACTGSKVAVEPIQAFNAETYLGTWHEIARMDHRFERGLDTVSATYTERPDGKFTVYNIGCKTKSKKWNDIKGSARLSRGDDVGQLSVSFFWPISAPYIIFEMDEAAADYAYVSGGTDRYLWLLARKTEVSDERKADFVEKAKALGYDLEKLVWVSHDPVCPDRNS
ncbi:MAG: lipocalin family protein [Pseudomonadota bacterium]